MATEKKKNTVVYPRTNHDETFDSLGFHRIGDFEDLYRRSRSTEQCDKDTNEGNIETLKVYSEELIREFVDIIFKKEISAINGILQETKYSFLKHDLSIATFCKPLTNSLQPKTDFEPVKSINNFRPSISTSFLPSKTDCAESSSSNLTKARPFDRPSSYR